MPTGETLEVATPEPVPPPTASSSTALSTTHRRHRTFSSSSSSSLSSVSSAASSPSPSPSGRATTTTSVPFSWEHHPGIPKTRHPAGPGAAASSAPTPLPLPPPLRAPTSSRLRHRQHQAQRRRASSKSADAADPFAAALMECTRERGAGSDAGLMDALFPARVPPAPSSSSAPASRRWSSIASAGGVVGLLDLYGCRSAMGVAEGAFVVRRPVAVVRAVPAGRAGLARAARR